MPKNHAKGIQADGPSGNKFHKFTKIHKRRIERRRAKHDPQAVPGYGKYRGWET